MKIPDEIVRVAMRAFDETPATDEGSKAAVRAAGDVIARWAMEEAAKIADDDMLPAMAHDLRARSYNSGRKDAAAAIRQRKDEI